MSKMKVWYFEQYGPPSALKLQEREILRPGPDEVLVKVAATAINPSDVKLSVDGACVRVVAGIAYGARSPVSTLSKLFYVDAHVPQGKTLHVPDDHVQRAAYLVEGGMHADGEPLHPGEAMVSEPGAKVTLRAGADSHVVLPGGAPLDAPRYLWWNYVASTEALLKEAKQGWREQRYAMVEGDPEFIPLPGNDRKAVRFEAG